MRRRHGPLKEMACWSFIVIASWLFLLFLVSCTIERDKAEVDVGLPAPETRVHTLKVDHVCGASLAREDFCPTDFVRLAASPMSADGKELWILGYLAVDDGAVVLYSSEHAYMNMEYGRSIWVEGTRSDLVSLISEFGYQNVRLAGEFRANSYQDPKNGRLGAILPPVEARRALPRIGGREGVDDIGVGLEYEQQDKMQPIKGDGGN